MPAPETDPGQQPPSARFDVAGFRRAVTARDVPAWLAFFADDAEWLEYHPSDAPRAPVRIRGRAAIARYLEEIAAEDMRLAVEDEVVGADRVAFRIVCDLADGRRMVEHAIATIRDGRIARMVEIEAWAVR
jgi:ketosteroid isomerase-like protein